MGVLRPPCARASGCRPEPQGIGPRGVCAPPDPAGSLSCQAPPSPAARAQASAGLLGRGSDGGQHVVTSPIGHGAQGALPICPPVHTVSPPRPAPKQALCPEVLRAQPFPLLLGSPHVFLSACDSFWKLCSPRSHERCASSHHHPQMIFLNKGKETPALICCVFSSRSWQDPGSSEPWHVQPWHGWSHCKRGA